MKNKILIFALVISSITQAFACSCAGENFSLGKKVKIEFKLSDLVFTGKVLEIIDNEAGEMRFSGYPLIYKFEITQTFKGKLHTKIIDVVSVRSSISCGYEFEIGETYLVYAINSDFYKNYTGNTSDIITDLCRRNNPLAKTEKKELKKLERLSKV